MEDFVEILIAVAVLIAQLIARLRKRGEGEGQQAPQPQPAPRPRRAPRPAPPPMPPGPARPVPSRPAPRPGLPPQVLTALDGIDRRAAELAEALEVERSSYRFVPILREWVPRQTRTLREAGQKGQVDARELRQNLGLLGLVLREVEIMAADRRDATLGPALADADALAAACLAPVREWARAENLPLAEADPATRFAGTDLMVWLGFQPTPVTPIFLPPDFFTEVTWWPAVAHEVAHSFLYQVRDLDQRLRRDLGLPSESLGTRPLGAEGGAVTRRDLERVFGGWFEELFADVFSTLMIGPAYVRGMFAHFAAEDDPRQVLAVHADEDTGRYDIHPPRHLRLIAACQALAAAGQPDDAERLRAEWDELHALPEGGAPDRILFPMGPAYLAVPLGPLEEIQGALVERLVVGPLDALAGQGLADIGGLGWGPHEIAQAERARAALVAGRVPPVRDARHVVAGAVLAAAERPELEPEILRLARAAIPGKDSGEVRPDAYVRAAAQPGPGVAASVAPARRPGGAPTRQEWREAIVLRELLAPPLARRAPGARRA